MWTPFLFLSTVLADTYHYNKEKLCPIYFCMDAESSTCLDVSANKVIYSNCPETQDCPDFNLNTRQSLQCVEEVKQFPIAYECPKYISEGLECGPFDSCNPGFYCRLDNTGLKGICTEKQALNDKCTQAHECEDYAICNFGVCIHMFSILPNKRAEYSLACKSGIVKNHVCQQYSKTNGVPGKLCKSDTDCIATDGAQGECACAKNGSPNSYCKYHTSDEPVLRALATQHNGLTFTAKLMMLEVMFYPELNYVDKCMEQDIIEVQTKKMLKDAIKKCAGVGLGIVILTLGLLLV
jgi:hypothetical protein